MQRLIPKYNTKRERLYDIMIMQNFQQCFRKIQILNSLLFNVKTLLGYLVDF